MHRGGALPNSNIDGTPTKQSLLTMAGEDPLREGEISTQTAADSMFVTSSQDSEGNMLSCKYDTYSGVIIDRDSVPPNLDEFRRRLRASIGEWHAAGKRGVWLELHTANAQLIPVAIEFGFKFHRAEGEGLVLTLWLPTDTPNTLPQAATHTVGVGALVIDAKTKQVLLVQEKRGPAAVAKIWKVPTGLVESGEEISQAAMREVFEETGVKTEFVRLGAFRLGAGGNLAQKGKSNLFFMVLLRPLDMEATICPQASEIADARWFHLDDFNKMPFPMKGTTFDVLNRMAIDGDAFIDVQRVSDGKKMGSSFIYLPRPSMASAL